MLLKIRLFLFCIPVLFALAACGGGGGGSDSGPPSISYAGNTDPAVVTTTNATRLVGNILNESVTAYSLVALRSAENTNYPGAAQIGLARKLSGYLNDFLSANLASRSVALRTAAKIEIDETDPCESGSISLQGTLEDDGTGTLEADFKQCRYGNETIDGETRIIIYAADSGLFVITDAAYIFPNLTLTYPSLRISVSGSLRSSRNISADSEQLVVNMVTRDDTNGGMTKSQNLVVDNVYDNIFSPSSFSETITGRTYDSVHGFVDIVTLVPFVFSAVNQFFTDRGQLLLTGANNKSIKFTVQSLELVSIELDLDGDTTFEISYALSWADLFNEQNLQDSDSDGMHDVWEQANGLNSSDPSDADLDTDGDAFTNLEEYSGGTDPNDVGSSPPRTDLVMTNVSDPATVETGDTLTYKLTVNNTGQQAAHNVTVTDTLPAGMNFVSVWTSGGGSCSGTTTIICNLGTMSAISNQFVWISVVSTVDGSFDNTASVTTTVRDTDPANNDSTVTTTVNPPSSDLMIWKTASDSSISVGDSVIYTINVRNWGSLAAENVVVTDALPADMNFVSVTTTVGSCSPGATVTCNLGTLGPSSSSLAIRITATATAEGAIDNTATTTTTSLEPDTTNNSATASLTVFGTSAAIIQILIDAANPGDTIMVGPNTYFGRLVFNGKDVILRSRDGPATTILDGKGSRAIEMGPDGTIEGFTIQNAGGNFGGGIELKGSGSTIRGNVFSSNVAFVGGYGAAIGGNGLSAIIDSNLFRNNSCDSQWLSGVISFINNSSPVIVNNVFENNPCRGVNLSLPTGNTPLVINNTFVANDVGIRIDRRVDLSTQVYRNNILMQNGIGLEVDFGDEANNPTWENNLVFDNTIDYEVIVDPTWSNGNIAGDPLFVDAAGGEYRLQSGSPAIDTGSIVGAPVIDFDGTVRPLDGDGDTVPEIDVGAFEAPAL